jgi:hypothetical protein
MVVLSVLHLERVPPAPVLQPRRRKHDPVPDALGPGVVRCAKLIGHHRRVSSGVLAVLLHESEGASPNVAIGDHRRYRAWLTVPLRVSTM